MTSHVEAKGEGGTGAEAAPPQETRPATPPARAKRFPWLIFGIVFVLVLITRIVITPRPSAPKPVLELPAYTLTDHHGKAFGASDLRGKPYVADFVFTSCPSVCPRLTKRMVEVQKRTEDLGDKLHLVTFSVDPENDTPEVLAAYGRKYGADDARWTFLTGPLGEVETVVLRGFKIAMGKKETSEGILEIFHGERLVLVDAEGKIRGFYDADDAGIQAIVRDARLLLKN